LRRGSRLVSAPEHAVIVTYSLSGDAFGSTEERQAVRALEERLTAAIDTADVGELDGDEFGGGKVNLYAYGPDAVKLFAAMEPELRAFPPRPAHATLRFGAADDPAAVVQRITL
jgi:hypothetical protein